MEKKYKVGDMFIEENRVDGSETVVEIWKGRLFENSKKMVTVIHTEYKGNYKGYSNMFIESAYLAKSGRRIFKKIR